MFTTLLEGLFNFRYIDDVMLFFYHNNSHLMVVPLYKQLVIQVLFDLKSLCYTRNQNYCHTLAAGVIR